MIKNLFWVSHNNWLFCLNTSEIISNNVDCRVESLLLFPKQCLLFLHRCLRWSFYPFLGSVFSPSWHLRECKSIIIFWNLKWTKTVGHYNGKSSTQAANVSHQYCFKFSIFMRILKWNIQYLFILVLFLILRIK